MRIRKGRMVVEKTKQLAPSDNRPAEPDPHLYGKIVDDDEMDKEYKQFLLSPRPALNKTRSENDDEMDEGDKTYMLNNQMAAANKKRGCNDDDDKMDEEYKQYLLSHQKAAASKKRIHNDDDDDRYHEEENDPDYVLFLENLKAHEHSYVLEYEGKENGLNVGVRIEYEEKLSPDREGNLEPRRNLGSAEKHISGGSSQIPYLENRPMHDSKSEESDKELDLVPSRKLRSAAKHVTGGSSQILHLQNRPMHDSESEESDKELDRLRPRRNLRSAAKHVTGGSSQILHRPMHDSQSEESDKELDREPRRKLKSAAKHISGDSNQILRLQNPPMHNSQSEKLGKEWTLVPRRNLRSAAKQIYGDSTQNLRLQNHQKCNARTTPTIVKLPEGKLGNKTNNEKGKSVMLSNLLENVDEVEDDYRFWMQGVKLISNDCYVFKCEGYNIKYSKDGKVNVVNKEYNDKSSTGFEFVRVSSNSEEDSELSSDVEFLGSTFDKIERNAFCDDDIARFKQKVIAALEKPYSQKEYDELLKAMKLRRPEERHLDLRHGRERAYSAMKEGKSYLDYYPDLENLLKVVDDKGIRLNLLRGFFIWLKQPEMLAPWKDSELLSIKPRSG